MVQVLIAIAFAFASFTSPVCQHHRHHRPAHQQPRITEDDPRWNCHTMGNRICGPIRRPQH